MACNKELQQQGLPFPRTCQECGLWGKCKRGVTLATAYAASLLEAGWTVRHNLLSNEIEWSRPDGVSCSEWRSFSLDDPPQQAITEALQLGQIHEIYWTRNG